MTKFINYAAILFGTIIKHDSFAVKSDNDMSRYEPAFLRHFCSKMCIHFIYCDDKDYDELPCTL